MKRYLLLTLETEMVDKKPSDYTVAVHARINIAVGEPGEKYYCGHVLAIGEVGMIDERTQEDWKTFIATRVSEDLLRG